VNAVPMLVCVVARIVNHAGGSCDQLTSITLRSDWMVGKQVVIRFLLDCP
jgi:hypothetical protein